jgi:hypothetical protein
MATSASKARKTIENYKALIKPRRKVKPTDNIYFDKGRQIYRILIQRNGVIICNTNRKTYEEALELSQAMKGEL